MKKDQTMNVPSFFRTNFVAPFAVAFAVATTLCFDPARAIASPASPAASANALLQSVRQLASPMISRVNHKYVVATEVAKRNAHRASTIFDRLNTPTALIKPSHGLFARPQVVNPVSNPAVNSTPQTLDYTLPTENGTLDTTTVPGVAARPTNLDPVWAPSESFIVFSSNRTSAINATPAGNYHLFAIAASGDPTTLTQLTSGTGNERWPTLASDTQIAFCEGQAEGGPYSLYLAPITVVNGSMTIPTNAEANLVDASVLNCQHPSYTGDVIAFAGRVGANPYHIYTFTVSNSTVTQLTSGPADEENPAISPVDSDVAFDSNAIGVSGGVPYSGASPVMSAAAPAGLFPRQVFVCRLSGQDINQVTGGPANTTNAQPAWGNVGGSGTATTTIEPSSTLDAGETSLQAPFAFTTGKPATTLTAPAAAGDGSVTVGSTVGFTVGQEINIGNEQNTVGALTSATVLALGQNLQNAHGNGTNVDGGLVPGNTIIPVTSVQGFAAGQVVTIDPGANQETVTIASTSAAPPSITTSAVTKKHFPNVEVTGQVLAGVSVITLGDNTGIVANERLEIDPGLATQEIVVVQRVNGDGTITLTAPLQFTHSAFATVYESTAIGATTINVVTPNGANPNFVVGGSIKIDNEVAKITSVTANVTPFGTEALGLQAALTARHFDNVAVDGVTAVGDTTLMVASVTGFILGSPVTIGATGNQETDVITAINAGTDTLTLQTGLTLNHPGGSPVTSPGSTFELYFTSNRINATYGIFYLNLYGETTGLAVIGGEPAGGQITKLLTSDPQNGNPTGAYFNTEPAVPNFQHYQTILYVSNRFLVNNIIDNPVINGANQIAFPSQEDVEPISTQTAGSEILSSQIFDITPPTLLRYNSNEIVHVDSVTAAPTTLSAAAGAGASSLTVASGLQFAPNTRILLDSGKNQEQLTVSTVNGNVLNLNGVTQQAHAAGVGVSATIPTRLIFNGHAAKFVVRLSDRQSGVGQVYLQIKDPDSKYQYGAGLEHKVYTNNGFSGASDESNTLFGFAYGGIGPTSPIQLGDLVPGRPITLTLQSGIWGTLHANTGGADTVLSIDGFADPNSAQLYVGDLLKIVAHNANPASGGQIVQILQYVSSSFANGNTPSNVVYKTSVISGPLQNPQGGGTNYDIYLYRRDTFVQEGVEVDCQAIDAGTGGQVDASVATNFAIPPFTPGIDDVNQADAVDTNSSAGGGILWLPMTPVPVGDPLYDANGGALYEATWQTPAVQTDYYIDVVAFDQANESSDETTTPYAQNWRIYDNVWGFTTRPWTTTNTVGHILVVNDYMLPQKYFSGRFGIIGLANVPPNYFGGESYLTDIDANYYDSNGTLAWLPSVGREYNDGGSVLINTLMHRPDASAHSYAPFYANTLGVNSYFDVNQSAIQIADTTPVPKAVYNPDGNITQVYSPATPIEASSQQYDIYRILSRGPIPSAILALYNPTIVNQPADVITGGATPKSRNILAANSCIIWDSPFAGDEFADNGTIADPTTQAALTAYVQAGGRLFVSGTDVGFALTQNGITNNNTFFNGLLDAKYVSAENIGGGTATFTLTGSGNKFDFVTYDAYINNVGDNHSPSGESAHTNFKIPVANINNDFAYGPPSAGPLDLANNSVDGGSERTDASLNDGGESVQNFLSGFTLALGQSTDANYPYAAYPQEYQELKGSGQSDGLAYTVFAPPANATNGGGISVYSSFGLESVSQEVQEFQDFNPNYSNAPAPDFEVYEQRTDLMHNLICFMRTGTVTGNVITTQGGAGVGGAEVVLTPEVTGPYAASNPPVTYTGITQANTGFFSIQGLPPGRYEASAYRAGTSFQHGQLTAVQTHGGDSGSISLQVAPAYPANLTVKVVDPSGNALPGATVTLAEIAGTVPTQTATTKTDGTYTFTGITAATYNVTASDASYTSVTVSNYVVGSASSQTLVIQLGVTPGTFTGTVSKGPKTGSNGIAGAIVTLTPVAPTTGAPINSVATPASGVYTFTSVRPGTYTLTAVANGYQTVTTGTETMTSGALITVDFPLVAIPPPPTATVYGIFTQGIGGPTIQGATITLTNATVPTSTFTTTTTTTFTGPDGKPANYGVSGLPFATYNATASATGVPTQTASNVIVNSVTQRLDFSTTPIHSFASGLQMFSIPYDYSASGLSLSQILNYANPKLAVWQPLIGSYAITPTPPANTITLGRAYWARFPSAVGVFTTGVVAPAGQIFKITLNPGWNMVGYPFTSAGGATLASLAIVDSAGNTYSWAKATGSSVGIVAPVIYSYDNTANAYVAHFIGNPNPVAGASEANPSIVPYVGYWFESFGTETLEIPAPVGG